MFWFNTFFIDMHLLQQHNPNAAPRSSQHHKLPTNNGGSDHRNPSTSSEVGTSAVVAHSKVKGHHRQRSDTPLASGGKSSRSHRHHHRAMSPSTSESVSVSSSLSLCPLAEYNVMVIHLPFSNQIITLLATFADHFCIIP